MRRRWSNNGGFQTMRMLEESSSEVTSSSALGLPPAMVMSPESLASPEYGGLELWGYEDALGYGTGPSLLGTACAAAAPPQPAAPLPSMPLPMPPTTPKSENESISSAGVRPIAAVVDLCSEYLDPADGDGLDALNPSTDTIFLLFFLKHLNLVYYNLLKRTLALEH